MAALTRVPPDGSGGPEGVVEVMFLILPYECKGLTGEHEGGRAAGLLLVDILTQATHFPQSGCGGLYVGCGGGGGGGAPILSVYS